VAVLVSVKRRTGLRIFLCAREPSATYVLIVVELELGRAIAVGSPRRHQWGGEPLSSREEQP
jgi:hypothetical protein